MQTSRARRLPRRLDSTRRAEITSCATPLGTVSTQMRADSMEGDVFRAGLDIIVSVCIFHISGLCHPKTLWSRSYGKHHDKHWLVGAVSAIDRRTRVGLHDLVHHAENRPIGRRADERSLGRCNSEPAARSLAIRSLGFTLASGCGLNCG